MTSILGIVALVMALGAAVFSWLKIRQFTQRLEGALGGTNAGTLEAQLAEHHQQMDHISQRLTQLNTKYSELTVTSSVASQKISIVRFNPFGDTGGDQSFSLAVLDAHDSGYVLTSIHGRQGTRVYIKPVDYGKSKYSLSDEERQALTQAIKRVPQLPAEAQDLVK
jgi:hypothetical protein